MNRGRMLPLPGAVASGGSTESGRCISIPMGRSAAVPITFTVVCALACAPAATPVTTPEASANRATGLDATPFEAILRHTLARSTAGEIRVDPRPLRPDPSLATLHGLGEIIPDLISPTAHHVPLAHVEANVIERRQGILAALGIDEADGLHYVACPGFMIPPSDEVLRQRRERCPATEYEIIMLALPRAGGAHLPPNTDERAKDGDRPVQSVRVIRRKVGPRGSMETSADYVFERVESDAWRLLEIRELLIIE